MKKVVFLISLCALALSAGAQIKVQSNGNIAIHTTSTASSPISINCQGNSSNYLTCLAEGKNGTLTGNNFYSATPLNIGYNVTTEKPYGNVVISSGGKLSIQKGTGGVTIKNGFECELGGELIIK